MLKVIIIGALIGSIVAIALFSVLDLFNFIYYPSEIPSIRAINGFAAVVLGGFIAGYYSKPRSLPKILVLSIIFSIITLIITLLSFGFKSIDLLYRSDFYTSLIRNFVLNIISVIVGSSIGSMMRYVED